MNLFLSRSSPWNPREMGLSPTMIGEFHLRKRDSFFTGNKVKGNLVYSFGSSVYDFQLSVVSVCVFCYKSCGTVRVSLAICPMPCKQHADQKSLTGHSKIHLGSRVSVMLPSHITSSILAQFPYLEMG